MLFRCPVCGESLHREKNSLLCQNGHMFDIARQGYVNLLRSNKAKHGDDKRMVQARRNFLERGYYRPLLDALFDGLFPWMKTGDVLLDAGCGECWYTSGLLDRFYAAGVVPEMAGVDISKEALRLGGRRDSRLHLAVASVFAIPMADASVHGIYNVFAPAAPAEYRRLLRPGGVLTLVLPLPRHLFQLKEKIYDNPVENPFSAPEFPGFSFKDRRDVRERITLERGEDIQNLFWMTPYCYKTSVEGQRRLEDLRQLETELEFAVLRYEKKPSSH